MAKELSSHIINPGKRYQQVSLQHDKNVLSRALSTYSGYCKLANTCFTCLTNSNATAKFVDFH